MSIKSLAGSKDGDAGKETPQGDVGAANDAEGGEGEEEHDLDWWKAQARKHERNAKANKAKAEANEAAAAELRKLKEADMTEAEKVARHASELQAQVDAYKAEKDLAGWAKEVSKATGVPEAALHGSTLEEVEACAEALKEFFPKKGAAPVVNTGKPSTDGTSQTTRDQFAEVVDQLI